MLTGSQTSLPAAAPQVVIVAGVAGSGKTTLGRAVAARLGLAPIDLDSVTDPLLDALVGPVLQGHWLQGPQAAVIRSGRYAALRAVAHDLVSVGLGAVLIAPFTEELQGGAAWDALVEALRPARVLVVHLDGPAEVVAQRRATRGTRRDDHRIAVAVRAPLVAHVRVDVLLTPEQQLFRALLAAGHRRPPDPDSVAFTRDYDAVLCDLDGTLADSTAAVLRSWSTLADEFGFDRAEVQQNHGRPAESLLRRVVAPERVSTAAARIEQLEAADVSDVTVTPGALALLAALPTDRTTIVTSGTRRIATARLRAAGIAVPATMVTKDDVDRGKPDPEPYLLAAARLGVDPSSCLVFEDAPAGIRSAKRAGCTVIAVRGTESDDALAEADVVLDALDQLHVQRRHGAINLTPFGSDPPC